MTNPNTVFALGTAADPAHLIAALAFDPSHSSTIFLGGSGTPNIAKSLAGGAGWIVAAEAFNDPTDSTYGESRLSPD